MTNEPDFLQEEEIVAATICATGLGPGPGHLFPVYNFEEVASLSFSVLSSVWGSMTLCTSQSCGEGSVP